MKILHDMAEKNVFPVGVGGGGWVFSKFKDRFKPINIPNLFAISLCLGYKSENQSVLHIILI